MLLFQGHIQEKIHNMAYLIFRVTLLELLSAQLNEEGSGNCGVPPTVAHFLAGSFQKGCGAVLTLATSSISSDEVRTVSRASSGPCLICLHNLGPIPLCMNLPASCNYSSGPAGGADRDQSAGCPL